MSLCARGGVRASSRPWSRTSTCLPCRPSDARRPSSASVRRPRPARFPRWSWRSRTSPSHAVPSSMHPVPAYRSPRATSTTAAMWPCWIPLRRCAGPTRRGGPSSPWAGMLPSCCGTPSYQRTRPVPFVCSPRAGGAGLLSVPRRALQGMVLHRAARLRDTLLQRHLRAGRRLHPGRAATHRRYLLRRVQGVEAIARRRGLLAARQVGRAPRLERGPPQLR
jgi:hypothetical protein